MFTAQVLPTAKFLSTLSLRRATKACRTWTYERLISIHALLAESDGASSKYMSYGWDFYPRSPCGERRSAADLPRPVQDFYPRSPCGERQVLRYGVLTASLISIHALLAESDLWRQTMITSRLKIFLSTLSLRRATAFRSPRIALIVDFYPRSPCGERRSVRPETRRHDAISIHALLAESDPRGGSCYLDNIISIHALLAESDSVLHRSAPLQQ